MAEAMRRFRTSANHRADYFAVEEALSEGATHWVNPSPTSRSKANRDNSQIAGTGTVAVLDDKAADGLHAPLLSHSQELWVLLPLPYSGI
jgi:hypothetical protein